MRRKRGIKFDQRDIVFQAIEFEPAVTNRISRHPANGRATVDVAVPGNNLNPVPARISSNTVCSGDDPLAVNDGSAAVINLNPVRVFVDDPKLYDGGGISIEI